MSNELLPCPFCGGEDLQHLDSGVFCNNFECEGGVDFGHFVGGNEEESKICMNAVAKAWNTRKGNNNTKAEGIREAVKETGITVNIDPLFDDFICFQSELLEYADKLEGKR